MVTSDRSGNGTADDRGMGGTNQCRVSLKPGMETAQTGERGKEGFFWGRKERKRFLRDGIFLCLEAKERRLLTGER
jgi:hypothetical protein